MKKQSIITIAYAILTLLPYLIVGAFAAPSGDDFYYYKCVATTDSNGLYIFKMLKEMNKIYFKWQGTYTHNFLMGCEELILKNGFFIYRVVCILSILIFAFSLYVFFKGILKYFKIEDKIGSAITAITFFIVLTNSFTMSEIFLWFPGIAAYTFPISMGLFSIGILLSHQESKKAEVISCIFAFIAAGGSLMISAFICGILLIFVFDKSINKRMPFIVSFIGALVNVAAPGNYVREDDIDKTDTGLHLFKSVYWSVKMALSEIADLFIDTPFLIFLILFFIVALVAYRKIKFKNVTLLSVIYCFALVIAINYPLALGYGKECYISRGKFAEALMLILAFMLLVLFLVEHLNEKINYTIMGALSVTFAMGFIFGWDIEPNYPKYLQAIATGELTEYSNDINDFVELTKEHQGEDIVVDATIENYGIYTRMFYTKKYELEKGSNLCYYFGINSLDEKTNQEKESN